MGWLKYLLKLLAQINAWMSIKSRIKFNIALSTVLSSSKKFKMRKTRGWESVEIFIGSDWGRSGFGLTPIKVVICQNARKSFINPHIKHIKPKSHDWFVAPFDSNPNIFIPKYQLSARKESQVKLKCQKKLNFRIFTRNNSF